MVDYNNFAKTFSDSRKNMKWEEIEYFLSFLEGKKDLNILDIGCGNGRLLGVLQDSKLDINSYLGIDLSKGLLKEAKKTYPNNDFLELNMLDLDKIEGQKFDYIFFIASFHHLESIKERKIVLKQIFSLLKNDGIIFMTNWALNSQLNKDKYSNSIIAGSENDFGSLDYSVKIGEYARYYHCFNLKELEYLFKENSFEIIESRLFDSKKNFISIIKKS